MYCYICFCMILILKAMKRQWIIWAADVVAAVVLLSSCQEIEREHIDYVPSINGLWASSGNDIDATSQTMMLAEFHEGNAIIKTFTVEKGLSSISDNKVYDAAVTYDNDKGEGAINVPGDPSMSFEFGLSKGSDKMYLRNDSKKVVLSYYNTSLKEMEGSLKELLQPRIQLQDGFVGPSQWVDLTAEKPLFNSTVASDLQAGSDILKWIGEGLVTGSASTVAKLIIESLIEDDEAKQLDEILSQINLVNAQLAELINLVHNTTYERYLNERTNTYVNPMRNLSYDYILRVEEAWQKDPDSVGPIVIEWANRTVGGNPAYVEAKNFMDYLTTTVVEQKNLYQMYDMYVYNTHAWENSGYEIRENLRAGDLAVIAQSLFLTRLYYAYGDFTDSMKDILCKELLESFENFSKYFEANSVERRDAVLICQVKGAHFIMEKELVARDYQNHPWMPYYTPWEFENQESAWWLVNGDTKYTCAEIYQFCINETEMKALAEFYKNSPYSNMLDALVKDAGCTLPFSDSQMSGKKIMMQLQSDGRDPHQEDNNYYINIKKAVEASKDFTVGEKTIGIAWLERHGFLWLEQWFRQWDTYYSDQLWFRTEVLNRY